MVAVSPAGRGQLAPGAARARRPDSRRRAQTALWGAVVTAALLALGFRPAVSPQEEQGAADSVAAGFEADRGRLAATPSEIQPRGWKDILVRVKNGVSEDRVLAIAAGIAFFALLSIVPAIAAFVSLYGLFADTAAVSRHVDTMAGVIPAGGMDIVREQMTRVATRGTGALGLTFLISLALSLWSANGGTKALFDALNVVYGEKEKRGFFKLTAITLLFTLGGILFLLAAIAAVVVVPVVLNFIGIGSIAESLIGIVRWPILLVGVAFALALVYRFGPSREEPQWRWISWGSTFAAIVWLAASMLFSWYAANFGSYNETYGSLGAVIGFATWIWLSAIVVLAGAEINAEMEHQTVRDTTTGAPRPMGSRGATMADTVGRSHR